jgi:hypothetical protein
VGSERGEVRKMGMNRKKEILEINLCHVNLEIEKINKQIGQHRGAIIELSNKLPGLYSDRAIFQFTLENWVEEGEK